MGANGAQQRPDHGPLEGSRLPKKAISPFEGWVVARIALLVARIRASEHAVKIGTENPYVFASICYAAMTTVIAHVILTHLPQLLQICLLSETTPSHFFQEVVARMHV